MSEEERRPTEETEDPAVSPTGDGLSAAKEKPQVGDEDADSGNGGGSSADSDDDDFGDDDDAADDGSAGDDPASEENDRDDFGDGEGPDGDEDGHDEALEPEETDDTAEDDDDSDDDVAGDDDPAGSGESGEEGQAGDLEPVESQAVTEAVATGSVSSGGGQEAAGNEAAAHVEVSDRDGAAADGSGEEPPEVEVIVAEAVAVPVAIVAAASPVTDVVASDHVQHLRLLEALLFAGTQALDEKELADRLPNDADLPRLLGDLAELYANRGINLVKVAGGYAFRTAPDLSEKLKIERPVTRKLSRASVETLAIIAFHQPVTRAEIEQVRGVGLSKGTLDLLFEQNWIKPMGRRRAPGKPVTWGTTDFFLEHFGLASLDDLPGHEEMRAAGLLDARAQPPIFRPEEPDLPLEPTEDEAVEPLAADDKSASRATGPQ